MLVLSRKANESIQIGDNVTVEIRRIAGNRVTVAINAPRDVRILRGELEHAAKAFEEPASDKEAASDEGYSVRQSRVKMPRLLRTFPETQTQAVG